MNEPNDADKKLELLLDRTLRKLPLRCAPPTLEARVFAELARRAALPWWRHSFAHWPRAARTVFVLISASLGGLALLGGAWAVAGLASMRVLRQFSEFAVTTAGLFASLVRAIPAAWLYEGMAAATVLYVLLFALGATAYRTLYLRA